MNGARRLRSLAPALPFLMTGIVAGQGKDLTVDIRVAAVAMLGDTTTVNYVLRNLQASQESLFTFTVDAPSPVLMLVRPGSRQQWNIGTDYRGRSVADFAALGSYIAPGDSTPLLGFGALGLPGIVTAWYGGHFPLPSTFESDSDTTAYVDVPEVDPLTANSVQTTTVGIDPIAPGTTDPALVERLGSLTTQACSLIWITSGNLCNSLQSKLDKAARDLQHGKNATAKADLQSFNTLLETNHGPGSSGSVGDSAYWLLRVNADYVIGRL